MILSRLFLKPQNVFFVTWILSEDNERRSATSEHYWSISLKSYKSQYFYLFCLVDLD